MQPGAPYTVTGFKGGYATWLGAVKAAKARGTTVTDKDGKVIYPPKPSPQAQVALTALRAQKCPTCGSRVTFSASLSGWVQCEQRGTPAHRARPDQPGCDWQGFTDGWERKL